MESFATLKIVRANGWMNLMCDSMVRPLHAFTTTRNPLILCIDLPTIVGYNT
jgi:hypothetical protein